MEQIAEAAGVARTTIHRRFASREALIASLVEAAWRQVADAVRDARPATAPPLVALHEATANILRIKSKWPFAFGQPAPDAAAARVQEEVFAACDLGLQRAQQAGIIRPGLDITWTRRVYVALLDETVHGNEEGDPDQLADRVVETLLNGVGAKP